MTLWKQITHMHNLTTPYLQVNRDKVFKRNRKPQVTNQVQKTWKIQTLNHHYHYLQHKNTPKSNNPTCKITKHSKMSIITTQPFTSKTQKLTNSSHDQTICQHIKDPLFHRNQNQKRKWLFTSTRFPENNTHPNKSKE